jgi:cyanobactin maturation PatA/PatG family protease
MRSHQIGSLYLDEKNHLLPCKTLSLDSNPIYAIQPAGPFASDAFQRLRQFLNEQIIEGVERISIAGIVSGKARLLSGQTVPTVQPDLRGMSSWTTKALVRAAADSSGGGGKVKDSGKNQALTDFLERIYFEFRNLGITPQDRALNYAATNAFSPAKIFELALKDGMQFETIAVERSPVCRPDSDCWDIKLQFFDPDLE